MDGVTSGTSGLITAEINYAIGDDSAKTDVEILVGARVNVMFEGGDMRHPIIMGFRNKRTGNEKNQRYWHHDNIEMSAGGILLLKASNIKIVGNLEVTGGSMTHNGVNVGSTHTHPQNSGNHFGGGTDTSSPH